MSGWLGGWVRGQVAWRFALEWRAFLWDRERSAVVDGCKKLSGLALFLIWCNDTSMSETGRADSISINSTI